MGSDHLVNASVLVGSIRTKLIEIGFEKTLESYEHMHMPSNCRQWNTGL